MRAVILCGVLCSATPSIVAAGPAMTFERRCAACHTFGRGTLIGPDLKDVAARRPRAWLAAWIASPDALLRAGDRTAAELFERFKPQRMPDQPMSAGELAALIDYISAGGPEAEARRNRSAGTATPAEVELGRSLFAGQRAFAGGDAPCSACHRAGDAMPYGGTLGPDLATAYARHQDKALASVLARGCVPRARPSRAVPALTDQEAFAVRAFLRDTTKARK